MRKVKLLENIPGGLQKAGWGVEMSDETAAELVANGQAVYLPADGPLKKGNLELYNNCIPFPAEKIAALAKSAAQPKASKPAVEAEDIQTNTNTTNE